MSLSGGPWVRIERDGDVTVYSGKVEIGQGIHTALAQIVADELGVPVERVRMAPVDTAHSPDEGITAGSRSIEEGGDLLRAAAREARGRGPEDHPAAREAPPGGPAVGSSLPRRDLPGKLAGRPSYIQDLELPGMLHGRIARPPSYGATLASIDEAAIRALPGVVAVVRDGSFLAVVADREDQAIAALERVQRRARWDDPSSAGPVGDPRSLLDEPTVDTVISERSDDDALARATRDLTAEYTRPYIAHASIGPSCALALSDGGRLTVWTHSQGPFPLRHELAKVLGVDETSIRVIHAEGAGCYGHNGADDAALDAALLARALPGRPIRVQWTREDEFAWEPYGPAMLVRLSAKIDAQGRVVGWTHDLWSAGHSGRPSARWPAGVASLLAARHLARPFTAPVPAGGEDRNAVPPYTIPSVLITSHRLVRPPVRVSALRALGGHANVFAIESFMDELAALAGIDPIAFRLLHLQDERARAVIEAVAASAGWRPGERGDGTRGRGIAFARYKGSAAYVAVVAEAELERDVRVRRVWAAVDVGQAVNPDGVVNQVEGGIVQATSWTLKEQVRFERGRVTSRTWQDYPILTFSEAPEVLVQLIDRPDLPSLGVGEAAQGPTSAAIANAIHGATGIRLRDLPLTRERLIAAMA